MGEVLQKAYEVADNIKQSNEYRYLAALFADVYAEKQELKQKLKLLSEQNLRLLNENIKLKGLK